MEEGVRSRRRLGEGRETVGTVCGVGSCVQIRARGGAISVATACSGTDVGVVVLRTVLEEVSASLTVKPPSILHKYSCDSAPAAQQFVLQHVDPPPEMFFLDISEISQECAFDAVSKQTVPVPCGLDMFLCGFECKSISGLNLSRSKNAKCLETKDPLTFIANVSQVKWLPFA